ncbi:DUF726 domain-containing protein [Gordonia sp. PS3]|uniref:DUF726 domain-containing protein n=1 Tax=Gordonia neofelifaecis NRRL B-59395 TaxID=644548 RepID=F1YE01_9ACTN|nr:DUF726 domain-containing protein [Gordonia neofelifaecis]EGD57091.1 hypothetical protein SCNU_01915 [Gordonia neofelifaecis NRRL B-59395]
MPTTLTFTPASHSGMSCEVRSPLGFRLTVSGDLSDVEPVVDGDNLMTENRALVHNTWAYARHEKLYRRSKAADKKQSHLKQAAAHEKVVKELAPLVEAPGDKLKSDYCSGCYTLANHRSVKSSATRVPTYLCQECGTPTLTCAAPNCTYMAIRRPGAVRVPRFCAEHRHDIPSFERATEKVDDIADYAQLHEFDERNLSRLSKVAMAIGAGAGVVATGGMLAAPAIGGAIGSLAGYTGAAATSYGLALLGGGSVASGGALAFGMVGGTYVVTAAGAALGGAMGSIITNSYIGEDPSFSIKKFRDGTGTPVIVARGFLTESDTEWSAAMQMVERRYPDSPIYRVHWGSKELKALSKLALKGIGAQQAAAGVAGAAARAGKVAAKKVPVAGALFIGTEVVKNPWHTALVRADRTGVALAGVIARTTAERYILVGHSLGARAMITATETLGTSAGAPRIQALHVLGAAEGAKGDWRPLNDAVDECVHNYMSKNDKVLKFAYQSAQAGSRPLGLYGFGSSFPKIKDHDVTANVSGHSEYFSNVRLR